VANRAPTISSHVLDTGLGRPAAGVTISLFELDADGREVAIASAVSDSDGRVADLLAGGALRAGTYRLRFDTGERSALFAALALDLRVTDPSRSYHVPLLLNAFGLSTYLGS
jgi:5-hydroxyisourate hydrolase